MYKSKFYLKRIQGSQITIEDLQTSATLHKYADDLTIHQAVRVEDAEIYINGESEIYIEMKHDRNLLQNSANEVCDWCSNNNMSCFR